LAKTILCARSIIQNYYDAFFCFNSFRLSPSIESIHQRWQRIGDDTTNAAHAKKNHSPGPASRTRAPRGYDHLRDGTSR
jgi:hypothetical protein